MKKFLKWFFIVLAILVVLYFVHSLITAKVYFDIYTAMKEKVESEDSFYGKVLSHSMENSTVEQEVFIKDNTFVKKITKTDISTNDKVELKLWQKYLPNKSDDEDGTGYVFTDANGVKGGSKFAYDPTAVEPEDKMYRYNSVRNLILGTGLKGSFFPDNEMMKAKEYTYSKMLADVLKNPTILYSTTFNGEKCYAIKQFYIFNMGVFLFEDKVDVLQMLFANYTTYISKDTKMLVAAGEGIDGSPCTYEFFTKEVTDEDIKLPNVEEYTLQENN